ncbi:sulfate adenylyltransferase [Halorussus salinisoli]|uniref:sulfate adenylyltransferase n=1 Tax=Halorussus salinisoli TaxID=2558242 RepID=UPI0010C1F9A2|nr:sulfate adenylyltransferase [Halorussus salinisoli]
MIEPHGGKLVDRVVGEKHREQLQIRLAESIRLDQDQYQDLLNIATGRYSPIEGFLDRNDFLKVINDMTLEDGTVWPLPIVLDVSNDEVDALTPGEKVGLKDPHGELVGAIEVSEIYKYNEKEAASKIFGTTDRSHPGVRNLYQRDDFFVGGTVFVFDQYRYNEFDLLPRETRVLFEHRGWESVVGFQTRNAPHRAHEYIQKSGLERVDGLLVQPKLGEKKPGDYRDEVILGAYQKLLESYYPDQRTALTVFPSKMNYAGPREAIFDALVRKNQGCSHFIIGRDHAGVKDFYGGFDAQRIFKEIEDLGIKPLFYDFAFYCTRCDGMVSEKVCPHDDDEQIHPSGTKIRELIQNGELPSKKMMRSEVASYIMDAENPFIERKKSQEQAL